jgi:predicted methyltransferase
MQLKFSRARLALLAAVALLLYVGYQAVRTLQVLDEVERERDTWQRPDEIIRALDLHAGDVVVDFGAGSGYFALRLAPVVGPTGRVVAIDLRRESLAFLWIRSALRREWQVDVVRDDEQEPGLPGSGVDAILIVNTYHELTNRPALLQRMHRTIKPDGRLVVAERRPATGGPGSPGDDRASHRLRPEIAAQEITAAGFDEVSRDDAFIDQADGSWWLMVFRRI